MTEATAPTAPPASETELLARAHAIAGLSLAELANRYDTPLPADTRSGKGWSGQLLERVLGATAGALAEPDFQALGVEMKTLPLAASGRPRESTYVCTVPLDGGAEPGWEASWVHRKLARVLWLPVEGDPAIPLPRRRVGTALLWSPEADLEAALRTDWEELMERVVMGEVDQLSAHLGTYLQIRPKGADGRALTRAVGTDGAPVLTLPRGFYLRTAFTNEILRRHYL
ncbi:MAG: DNA mismatch repair endonuclease MutH [Gammaproteobacteria bacterium]|nr:DNA mismatch repair endonuclease MutH [Gammaproteobacteria bacterium]